MGSIQHYPGMRRIHIPSDGYVSVYIFSTIEDMNKWLTSGQSLSGAGYTFMNARGGDYAISDIATTDNTAEVIYMRQYDWPQVHKDGYTYRAWAIAVHAGSTAVRLYP
jgi:hypothetical protein